MADDIVQVIQDAREDATSLSEFIYYPANTMVERRLAPSIHTLNYYLDYLHGLELIYRQPTGTVTVNGEEIKTVRQAINDSVESVVLGEYQAQLEVDLENEITRATDRENTIENALEIEVTRATNAENNLSQDITTFNLELSAQKLDTGITATPKFGGVTRTQAAKNSDLVSVKDFGAVGDGITDDTAALNYAFNNYPDVFLPAGEYLYTELNIDTPLILHGTGILKYSGLSGSGGDYTINVNAAFRAEKLHITTQGVDAVYGIARFNADNVSILQLEVVSAVQRNQTGGCVLLGNDVFIGVAKFKNIARPLALTNEDGNTANLYVWRKNVHVGKLIVDTYIRGIKYRCIENLSLGEAHITGKWLGRSSAPGFNGVLLETIKGGTFGDLYIADSLEHGMRIGGNEGSHNWQINSLYTKNTLGCGFKNAPTPPFKSTKGHIGSLTVYDAGVGNLGGNSEAVRLSSLEDTIIDNITVLHRTTDALLLADVKRVHIGTMYAEGITSRAVSFHQERDMGMGECDDFSIGKLTAHCNTTARYAIGAFYNAPNRWLNNIRIYNAYLTGFNYAAVGLTETDIRNSEFNITVATTDPALAFDGVLNNTIQAHYKRGGGNYFGTANNTYTRGAVTVDSPQLQLSNNDNKAGLYISSLASAFGLGNYGGWLGFSRLNSSRRGAAIAIKQTGATSTQNGLVLFVQNSSTTSNESMQLGLQVNHLGVLNLPRVPTSAAGLVAGDVYQDAGVLKIV